MAEQNCSLVLAGGNAQRAAPVMARLFAIDVRLAGQIAGAAPIVLLDSLSESQAAGVRAALAEMVAAGATLEVRTGSLGNIPRVGWPGVPRIAGKPASEYSAPSPVAALAGGAGTVRCPCCGATLKLAAAAAAPQAGSPPLKAPMGKRDSGFEEVPLPDALKALAAAPDELPDVPDVPEAPGSRAAKPAAPAPLAPVKGALSAAQIKPGSSAPMALEDFEAGLAKDDHLLASLDDGLPEVPDEQPRPLPVRPRSAPPRLEEISVAPESPKPAKPAARPAPAPAPVAAARPLPLPARPVAAAKPVAASAAKPATVAPAAPVAADSAEKCNIYINRTSNPKAHELLAKLHGISIEEAAEMANKPLVTVARNISKPQAEVIRKKFAENKISARISSARPSQRLPAQDGEGENPE